MSRKLTSVIADIPLPNKDARRRLLTNLLLKVPHSLSASEVEVVCDKTEGYSGSDLDQTVREGGFLAQYSSGRLRPS